MEPSPREEGFGPRAGAFDIRNALLIPRDPRGIVLACGFVALAALGTDALLVAGDWIGFALLVTAVVGYLFIRTRLVPVVLWAAVAAYGVLAAISGNASDWLVVGLAGLLVVVALFPPVDWTEEPTSRNLEVSGSAAERKLQRAKASADQSSRNLEVAEVARPNGSNPKMEPEDASAAGDHVQNRHRAYLRTIGSLQLELGGRDRLQRVRQQPRLEFLLTYLIARRVSTLGGLEERSAIAAELAPGYEQSTQLDRMRKTLHALGEALGPDLKNLLDKTSSHIRLDLTGIDVDFVVLSEMAAKVDRRGGLIDAALADEVRNLLETTAGGEFLAGFSELEQEVTRGRGDAARVVEDARMKVNGWRADLVVALARHFEAAGRAQSSIAYLQSVNNQSPEREDVARLLVAAYLQTGQIARAEEIQRAYKFRLGEVR
jgi:DNA-binding SARP family transcriptional activator